jgi:pyruvate carboxylase subunit B
MKYLVTLGGRTHEIVVDGSSVSVDGRSCDAHLERVVGTPLCHLLLDGRSHTFAVSGGAEGRWTLHHAGELVEVEVVDERTRHIRSLAGAGKAHQTGGTLRAPMPGLVVKVLVEPGQTVSPGQSLVVLEAMKMENELKAPGAAIVAAVAVKPGQAVEKGQPLVEMRAADQVG